MISIYPTQAGSHLPYVLEKRLLSPLLWLAASRVVKCFDFELAELSPSLIESFDMRPRAVVGSDPRAAVAFEISTPYMLTLLRCLL